MFSLLKSFACQTSRLLPSCKSYYMVVDYTPVGTMRVTFVETATFTKRVVSLELEDSLRTLQDELLRNPEAGAVDPGTGGLRKARMPDPRRGKGKRSGARVHYLWLPRKALVYLLYVYIKDEEATLTSDQKKQLRSVVMAIKRAHGLAEQEGEK